jgi:putative flippase GtrA
LDYRLVLAANPPSKQNPILALWTWGENLGVRILGWFGCSPALARQMIRFGFVGVWASATYIGMMALMCDVLGTSIVFAAFCAFVVATAMSFAGNALWTFGAQPTAGNAAKFLTVTLMGLVLNLSIAWVMERMGAGYLMVSLVILLTVPLFNFIGHRLVTFGGRSGPP